MCLLNPSHPPVENVPHAHQCHYHFSAEDTAHPYASSRIITRHHFPSRAYEKPVCCMQCPTRGYVRSGSGRKSLPYSLRNTHVCEKASLHWISRFPPPPRRISCPITSVHLLKEDIGPILPHCTLGSLAAKRKSVCSKDRYCV